MAASANSETLQLAFETHLEQTREQVERLKELFTLLGVAAKTKPCRGMAGLIEEGEEIMEDGKEKRKPRRTWRS